MMLDLTKLWNAMPRDVQRKISCHDLKRTVDFYNLKSPEIQRYVVTTDYPEHTVYDQVQKRDLFPTKSGNRDYKCVRCYREDAAMIAQALNSMESQRIADESADEKPDGQAENAPVDLTGHRCGPNSKKDVMAG